MAVVAGGGAVTHTIHRLPRGEIHVARAESVYPSIADGSVSLVISDGPYGMGKAAWDRQKGEDGLRAWYRPHVEAWGRVCAADATVYVWGTDDSASALRPLMREHGWTKRVRVTWDKVITPAVLGWPRLAVWGDVTEVCDVWTRGAPPFFPTAESARNVWRFDASNDMRRERIYNGKMPDRNGLWESRAPVHVSQKPLEFWERIVRASSRPGDLVLEPFGGTCRVAVAIERMNEADARRYVCIEPDEDGRGYVPAVLASMGIGGAPRVDGDLFSAVAK